MANRSRTNWQRVRYFVGDFPGHGQTDLPHALDLDHDVRMGRLNQEIDL